MATSKTIIRLALADSANEPILVQVSSRPDGHALDLDLLATDGESAYRGKLRERKLDKLRDHRYEGSSEEWADTLQHVFVPTAVNNLSRTLRDTLDVTCTISSKGSKPRIAITIRSSVEGITHKFGVVELQYSEQDTQAIDLFPWVSQAAEHRDALATELTSSKRRVQEAEEMINTLQDQLQELIKAKQEHETQLLSKFVLLLNEKKLRIRNQQRQLMSHGDNPTTGSALGTKHAKKRKGDDIWADSVEQSNSSDGFNDMDLDDDVAAQQEASDVDQETSDADTASDRSLSLSKNRPHEASAKIPPARELPFGPRNARTLKSVPDRETGRTVDAADEETASEDDEL